MNEQQPLLSTKTGGFSLLSGLLLIGGIICLILQAFSLLSDSGEASTLQRFVPALIGLALLLLFFLTTRKGTLSVFADHLAGRSTSGKKYRFEFSEIAPPDLRSGGFVLKNPEGKTLLVEKKAAYHRAAGLVWMLKSYPEMGAILQSGTFQTGPETPQAIRIFSMEEKDLFGDAGFVAAVGEQQWFFPVTDTKPAIRKIDQQDSLSTHLQPGQPIHKFEPNPARLPLADVWQNLSEAGLPEEALADWAETFAQAHGGCPVSDQGDHFSGELAGMEVRVIPLKKS